jgi:hypothetical protein
MPLRDRAIGWLDAVAEEGLVPAGRRRVRHHMYRDGDVARKLIPGEVVHDQVRHHGIYLVGPWLQIIASIAVMLVWLPQVPLDQTWLPVVVCGVVAVWGWYRLLARTRYLFVITDSRVFRISGVYTRYEGEMPLVRVLDIAVQRPWYLTPIRCGHLVLENAAQTQGLRDVRWISEPQARARLIHELRTTGDRRKPSSPPVTVAPAYRPRADHPARRAGRTRH